MVFCGLWLSPALSTGAHCPLTAFHTDLFCPWNECLQTEGQSRMADLRPFWEKSALDVGDCCTCSRRISPLLEWHKMSTCPHVMYAQASACSGVWAAGWITASLSAMSYLALILRSSYARSSIETQSLQPKREVLLPLGMPALHF